MDIEVATATDAGYLPYVAVLAGTLAAGRAPGTDVRLTVLCDEVSDAERARVSSGAPGIALNWVPVTPERYAGRPAPVAALARRPHYFRCLLPEVYPASTRRVLYVDADTVVNADLAPLWRVDTGGAPVAAVADDLGTVGRAISRWQELGLDPDAPYFNSGVLVVDLDAWRDTDAGWAAIARCAADSEHLVVAGRWAQYDQYGLNVVFHRRWHQLPDTWNYFSYRPYTAAGIVHFLGSSGRPGSRYCHPRYTRAFLDAVDRTAWAGWRPASCQPGWRRRWAWKRCQRAVQGLVR